MLSSDELERLVAEAICCTIVVGLHEAKGIDQIIRSAGLLTAAIAAVFRVRP